MNPATNRLLDQSGTLKSALALAAYLAQVSELVAADQQADPVPVVVEHRPATASAGCEG
jgi:hypothetical protein